MLIRYIIICKELAIYKEFNHQKQAYLFFKELIKAHPNAHIEKAKYTQFADQWGDNAYQLLGGE